MPTNSQLSKIQWGGGHKLNMKDIFKLGYQQRIFPLEKHVNSGTKPDENIVCMTPQDGDGQQHSHGYNTANFITTC